MGKIYLQRRDSDGIVSCKGCWIYETGVEHEEYYSFNDRYCGSGGRCEAGNFKILKQVIPKRLIRSEGNERD